jgi:hypothetical protein
MKKFYFSAVVKFNSGLTCVVGMQVITKKKEVDNKAMEELFKFGVERYLNAEELFAFGKITKNGFTNKTNVTITLNY